MSKVPVQLQATVDLSPLEARVAALEKVLAGVKREASAPAPDGTTVDYLMFPCRVGVQTEYWGKQPPGRGAAFSIGTQDRFAAYLENEGGDAFPPGEDLVTLYVGTIAPRATGRSVAIKALAANNPNGNVGVEASVQYAPTSPIKVAPVLVQEIDAADTILHQGVVTPDGVTKLS